MTMREKAPWITYRPNLKVLDCTIRDGGLINDHQFEDQFVRAVYDTCVEAGIDYMEIGYKNSVRLHPKSRFGPWRHCEEDDLRRVVGDHDPRRSGLKLAAMADAGKCDWKEQIIPKEQSVLDLIRVACYVHQISEAVAMVQHAHDLGYETCCNIMAISTVTEAEIDQALAALADTPVDTIVVVDSFGSLCGPQIDNLARKYLEVAGKKKKEVGIHAHNNMQLAFANTLEAIIVGCTRADATMAGLGRGAGNCPMELLLGFLRNPKFKLRPVIKLLQEHLVPMQRDLQWGALVPYNITGQMNCHPRSAIEFLAGDDSENLLAFYDKVAADI
jgi:4-hydroxy 2-oxovalerate aldolase